MNISHINQNYQFDTWFKVAIIFSLLYALLVLGLQIVVSYIIQSSIDSNQSELTLLNFILPNGLSLLLMILYGKELLLGYNPKFRINITFSMIVIITLIVLIVLKLWDFYAYAINKKDSDLTFLIALIILFSCFFGLILHRIKSIYQS